MDLEHCPCGRVHRAAIDEIIIGNGAAGKLPECLKRYGARMPFILSDIHTRAAGSAACQALQAEGFSWKEYVYEDDHLEPDERAIGAAAAHFDCGCDIVIGIGSGVINDIGKLLSHITGRKYIIVATAPSMDGYASATSSMAVGGLKVSLNTRCADVIIGDTDILRRAPLRMCQAGLGDMLAKYVSIAEWRISHLVTGEYYCEAVASMVREALRKCTDHAAALRDGEEEAVRAVFEGLVAGGIAMAYAGLSRPASGVEHYFSHIWDMRGLEFGTRTDLHGIQCAIAALESVKLYGKLRQMTPDREKAAEYVRGFDYGKWCGELRTFLGRGAESMIAGETKEHKYAKETHAARLERICRSWDEILEVLDEELPQPERLAELLDVIGIPRTPAFLGIDKETERMTFKATKDIRDKYVLSRLAWDLGVLDELAGTI